MDSNTPEEKMREVMESYLGSPEGRAQLIEATINSVRGILDQGLKAQKNEAEWPDMVFVDSMLEAMDEILSRTDGNESLPDGKMVRLPLFKVLRKSLEFLRNNIERNNR
jgi:hypothetical protein